MRNCLGGLLVIGVRPVLRTGVAQGVTDREVSMKGEIAKAIEAEIRRLQRTMREWPMCPMIDRPLTLLFDVRAGHVSWQCDRHTKGIV